MQSFQERLKKRRQEVGLNQRDLGVSARFFDDSDWEPPGSYKGMVFW